MSTEIEELEMVGYLAAEMRRKLRENSHKSHWREEPVEWLVGRLIEEMGELVRSLHGSPETVLSEAADVANFAAMIADVTRGQQRQSQATRHS